MSAANVRQLLRPLRSINPGRWAGRKAPPRDWLIEGVCLRKTVCLFNGPGSAGKSLLMLQLQTAAALGIPWLGRDVKQCRSFGLYAEDPEDEVWRRFEDIARHYGVPLEDLSEEVELLCADLIDAGPALYKAARRDAVGFMTPLWSQIRRFCVDNGRQLVIIDNAAFCYQADRIDEGQVVHFMDQLKNLAVEIDGCVMILQHPSASGMETKSGEAGSRGWNNSARSRIFLTFPPEMDDPENDPSDERVMRFMKANYGPRHKGLRIEWQDGVFVPVTISDQLGGRLATSQLIELNSLVFKAISDMFAAGERVNIERRAKNNVASILSKLPEWRPYAWAEILDSASYLVRVGRLAYPWLGPKSRRARALRPADQLFPGEEAPDGA